MIKGLRRRDGEVPLASLWAWWHSTMTWLQNFSRRRENSHNHYTICTTSVKTVFTIVLHWFLWKKHQSCLLFILHHGCVRKWVLFFVWVWKNAAHLWWIRWSFSKMYTLQRVNGVYQQLTGDTRWILSVMSVSSAMSSNRRRFADQGSIHGLVYPYRKLFLFSQTLLLSPLISP